MPLQHNHTVVRHEKESGAHTASKLKEILDGSIRDNQDNLSIEQPSEYDTGYTHGYHDALVDLMNKLGIPNNWELYND